MASKRLRKFILICGSYSHSRFNDQLCRLLGYKFAICDVQIVSAGSRPGLKIAESMDRTLTSLNKYDCSRVIFVYRRKGSTKEVTSKRIGSIHFVGNNIYELREYLFSLCSCVIVIGGKTRTKEEALFAEELKIPVIPVGITGGTAKDLWNRYNQSNKMGKIQFFQQLNCNNANLVSDAIVTILEKLDIA